MSYELNQLVLNAIKRRFGGVTPELRLDPQTHGTLKAIAKPIRRRFYCWMVPAFSVVWSLLGWASAALLMHFDGQPRNAVLDERSRTVWMIVFPVLMVVIWLGSLAEFLVLPRMLRWDSELWKRYHATEHGWLPRRALICSTAVVLPFAGFLFGLIASGGDRVDETGIAFGEGPLARRVEPYARVSAIELYSAMSTRQGVVQQPCLVVQFLSGTDWQYSPQPGGWTAPSVVAGYIAARTGTPVTLLGVRP